VAVRAWCRLWVAAGVDRLLCEVRCGAAEGGLFCSIQEEGRPFFHDNRRNLSRQTGNRCFLDPAKSCNLPDHTEQPARERKPRVRHYLKQTHQTRRATTTRYTRISCDEDPAPLRPLKCCAIRSSTSRPNTTQNHNRPPLLL
jgi:hypothetical protein